MGNVCNNPAPYPTDIPLPPSKYHKYCKYYKYYVINMYYK